MKNTLFIFVILISLFAKAQVNKYGTPQITYYSEKNYNSATQNWAAVQDNRNVMFFGNNKAVLRFDGKNWSKYKVNNETIVYSIAVDSNNIVYVGAVSEFGCLLPTDNGDLEYQILSDQIDSTINFSEIWKTYSIGNEVYFCSWDYIFVYSNLKLKKTIKLPEKSFHSFVVNNNIYVTHYSLGLLKYNGDSIIPVKGGEKFKEKAIFGILPFQGKKLLITTGQNGVFIFDDVLGVSEPFLSDTAMSLISKAILYNVTVLNNGNYAFSTLYGGVIITDKHGNVVYHLDENNGLADNIVTYTYQAKEGPLWLCLNNGISKLDINVPLNYYDLSKNIEGTLNDMVLYKNILYLATDGGVYYISNNSLYPKLIKTTEIEEQTWAFSKFKTNTKDALLIATHHGLFELTDTNKITDVESQVINENLKPKSIRAKNICKLKNKPVVLLSRNKKIKVLSLIDDNWNLVEYDFNIPTNDLKEDNKGNIWIVTEFDGVYKLSYKDSLKIEKHYLKNTIFEKIKLKAIALYNDSIIFGSNKGIYYIDEKNNKIKKINIDGTSINKNVSKIKTLKSKDVIFITNSDENKDAIVTNDYLYYHNKTKKLDRILLSALPKSKIKGYFAEKGKSKLFIGVGNKIYLLNKEDKNTYTKPPKVIFRKVSTKDSVLFKGIFTTTNNNPQINVKRIISLKLNDENKLVLDYKYNEITFKFATPYYYHPEELEYSYFMEGDDDEWSSWSKDDYDNEKLTEGDYTLKVKVRNIYGIESDISEYSFSINAPWYRTIWAYIIYAILIISIIILIVYLNNRRLLKDKARLEEIVKQRTAEVVAQKEEIEVQKEEIESQRDLVLDQKNKIEQIHEEITDSIHYAERIQRAILPAEEHVNKAVPEHFILFKPKDIVSGDYYWATVLENKNKNKKGLIGKLVITAADCTGHGVPGAFMSMLGVSFLNEIVNEKQVDQSHQILNMMRENVITSLQQTGAEGEQKDGMDMALMVIDFENNKVQFSGANNPLYVVRKKSLPELKVLTPDTEIRINETDNSDYIMYEIKGDKMPIAIHVLMDDFRLNEIEVMSGDTLYVFSDGYADQFGGKKGKKFKYKPFKRIFLENQDKSMNEQKEILNNEIEAWKAFINPVTNSEFEQIDDIVVIGVKIP